MRIFLAAATLVQASCAAITETATLEDRIASWTGSPVRELSDVLGEPTVVNENSWEWRLTSPGMQAATSTSTLSRQLEARDRNSAIGQATSPATGGKTWTPSGDTAISRKECVYRATVDGTVIVDIETVAVSGKCHFSEIPLRAKDPLSRQS